MSEINPVAFESPVQKELYKHIERNGPQDIEDVHAAVSADDDTVREELDHLKQQGFLNESGGRLTLGLDLGDSETYETKDFTYTVRPGREEDFDALVDTVEAIAEKKTYVIAERLAAELRYDETVLRHDSFQSRVFFVATVDDQIVGWSHLDLPLTEKLRPTAELTVGVHETHRGYGIATALLDRALEWAQANGFMKVYKNLARTNMQAVSFLEARGWEQEGVRENHYLIGHKQVDQIMMAYTF